MCAKHICKLSFDAIIVFVTMVVFCQCGNKEHINDELDLAEGWLSNNPDSSYIILEAIDTSRLNSRRVSARYSLLKSMAIDKMGIDTTDLEVIQPAVDYFLKKGNPDEKLRTYYYLGRIYQNQKKYELALKSFIRGKELFPEMKDSLVMARLLVAESGILSNIPNREQMLANYLEAAKLYDGNGYQGLEIDCLARALNLCVVSDNRLKADSIYAEMSYLIDAHPVYREISIPAILSYLITFGSREIIVEAIDTALNLKTINERTAKDIALGYNVLGNNVLAKQWLDSIPKDGKVITTPPYYLMKSDILAGLGDYQGALEAHKTLLEMVEKNYEATSKQDIFFAKERYEIEIENMNAIRNRERIIWLAIIIGFILLSGSLGILKRYRATRKENRKNKKEIELLRKKHEKALLENQALHTETESLISDKEAFQTKLRKERKEKVELQNAMKATEVERIRLLREREAARVDKELAERELAKEHEELENYRMEKEKAERDLKHEKEILEKEHQAQAESLTRLKTQISEMEKQTAQLNELLNQQQTMAPEVEKAIHDRIGLLNGMLATYISKNDKLAAKFLAERDKIINDREGFMNSTRLAYKASHPKFISYLELKGLTEDEINYACLFAIGMNGKEAGNYVQRTRHYHLSSEIRRKLGLLENETNLSIYVRKLLSQDRDKRADK